MPESDLTFLGMRIRAARKACDLTQQELADQTGLAIKTVQDIEHGVKNPTYETIALLIKRLGISASVLFPSSTLLKMKHCFALLENFNLAVLKIKESC